MKLVTTALPTTLLGLHVGLLLADTGNSDAGRMTIGYRSGLADGKQDEESLITGAGTLIQSRNTAATHLGPGVYIGNSPIQRDGDSLFLVTANEAAFMSTPKVWVPPEYWTLPVREDDAAAQREAKIARQQLDYYIEDHGLRPSRTMRLAMIDWADSDDIEQLLIPNDMLSRDRNGAPIETRSRLDTQVEGPVGRFFFSVDYDEWEGIAGSKVLTNDALRERSALLVQRAAKAARAADEILDWDSRAEAAEAMVEAVDMAKRCAEGVGHLHRRRPELVEFDDFNAAYRQYANARRTEAKFHKLTLMRAVETQKSKAAQAAGRSKDATDKASWTAEAEDAARQGRGLLEKAADRTKALKRAHERLDSIRKALDGGEEEGLEALVKNPRAVWAILQESFVSMGGKEQASLDRAIKDEAAIAQQEYSILQEGVNEAGAVVSEIEKTVEAARPTATKPDGVLCQRAAEDCVGMQQGERAPTAETADGGELVAMAEQKSKENFNRLLEEFDYGQLVQHPQLYDKLRVKLEEFRPLPRAERIARLAPHNVEGVLGVGGLALYGKDVADVFWEDTSVLDKVARITSIIPIIGCAVQLADDVQKEYVNAVHTALCFAEDALTLSGLWEIALAMQLSEQFVGWITDGNEQNKELDTAMLRNRLIGGWQINFSTVMDHLMSEEFAANVTIKLSSYNILTLYQAAQLAGDVHASHHAVSRKAKTANVRPQQGDIAAHVQPEFRRQICATIAQRKYQLQKELEDKTLRQVAELAEDYKQRFLDDFREAATRTDFMLGALVSVGDDGIDQAIAEVAKTRLPLYESRIEGAIRAVVERLGTSAPCTCLQGRRKRPCEFAHCKQAVPRMGTMDAAGRVYISRVRSMSHGKTIGVSEDCLSLFTTCRGRRSTHEIGRPLWCTAQ
ncbi:uncharacterized protein MAM_01118 [Metarhizium album ARSEF 1941]|uniref:Heat Labile Enterotoxin Type Iib n=1 Tax=Metarhizium album (strain ARSEF 1941) TaxID=1081103 RepID=A0A0B2X0Q2_METAS|nr:uncharacterized protein MAM_01118 [Metarhizium album ARSEF 1941]KHO02117.1 hypothetical protein MAM_01118 [Metarhizium album ARSEF 1941]